MSIQDERISQQLLARNSTLHSLLTVHRGGPQEESIKREIKALRERGIAHENKLRLVAGMRPMT